jgi:membrane-associated protein
MIRDLVHSIAGYPGLFFICAVSGIAFPLPEDFALIYAGVRISEGSWSWAPTIVVAVFGVLTRDLAAYGIGFVLGRRLLHAGWVKRMVGDAKLNWSEEMVRSHGPSAVLLGRFLIGFRAPIFMVAGATRVSFPAFAFWDLVGVLVAVPAVILLGFGFGEPIADTVFWVMARAREAVALCVIAGAVWLWWRVRNASHDSDLHA